MTGAAGEQRRAAGEESREIGAHSGRDPAGTEGAQQGSGPAEELEGDGALPKTGYNPAAARD